MGKAMSIWANYKWDILMAEHNLYETKLRLINSALQCSATMRSEQME